MTGFLQESAYPTKQFVVTPSNTVDCNASLGLYVGTAGNISLLLAGDTVPIVYAAAAAQNIPLSVKRVYATGTTAGAIVGYN